MQKFVTIHVRRNSLRTNKYTICSFFCPLAFEVRVRSIIIPRLAGAIRPELAITSAGVTEAFVAHQDTRHVNESIL